MEFEVILYRDERGNSPIDEFLDDLKNRQPVLHRQTDAGIRRLADRRSHRLPLTKAIGDGLFELRVGRTDIVRVLWFFVTDAKIVVVEAFVKKTDKTPEQNRTRALRRKEDYLRRQLRMP